jgi:hypothetical protein
MYRFVLLPSSLQTLRILFVHKKSLLCMAEVASEAITARALQWVDRNNVAPKHAVRPPTRDEIGYTFARISQQWRVH